MRGSRDAELVQEIQHRCESHAAYSEGTVFGIGHGVGSWHLFSRSPIDRSSEGDDQSTCGFIVIWASSIIRNNITYKCAFSFSSECTFCKCSSECSSNTQSPVLRAVAVPKHALESYHRLIARDVIVPAENSDAIFDIGVSGGHCIYQASDRQLVYGRIAGFIVRLSLVKLHCHWRGNWPGLFQSELRQDRPNVAVLMDVDSVMLPIAFDVQATIEVDTPEDMHPERCLHLILDLPNQALVSSVEEIINIQNNCGDNCALILKHKQSSVDK